MNNVVNKMLEKYNCKTTQDSIHALREILQEIALLGLWRSKFFEHTAFYGGSALRILYGLNRYSEDLDFSLLKRDENFSLEKYLIQMQKEINAFGFDISIDMKEKVIINDIQSAFLKANTLNHLLVISPSETLKNEIPETQKLKIKLEIDVNPPPNFNTEVKYLLNPIAFSVKTYSLPDLFAGKMHAILFRKWKDRVKGRDWFDLVWYISNHPKLHLKHLESRMIDSGDWENGRELKDENLIELLTHSIHNLNIENAKKDIINFIPTEELISIWSHEFFLEIINKIKII